MISLYKIRRRFWFSFVRFPWNRVRVLALRKMGFRVGQDVYIGPRLTLTVGMQDRNMDLCIGDRVSFGPNVSLLLASRPNNSRLASILPLPERKIHICNDAWIGANATILTGVDIGECTVVAANAVVTHNTPPYSRVAGVPARIIGYTDKKLLEELL